MTPSLLVLGFHLLSYIQSSLLEMDRQNLGNRCDIQIELKLDGVETKWCIQRRDILGFYKSTVRAAAYGHPVKGSMEEPCKPADMTTLHKGGP